MAPQEKSRINNLAVGAFAVLKQGNHIKGPRLYFFICFILSLLLCPLVCYSSHFYFYWGWSKQETLLILPWLKKHLTNVCLGILVLNNYMALQLHKPENHYSSLKLFLYSRKSIHTSNHDAAVGQYV